MKIQWTDPAVKDLENIYNYISTDSEFYAKNFIDKIISNIDFLPDNPKIGRIVPESDSSNIRELIVQNYRIMYRILPGAIQILTIVHSSRNILRIPE